jgi:hypothetical protein
MAQLRRIPGVVRVAFGLKETAGQILRQWAYRVYLQRKLPSEEVPAEERIPPEIYGVKTDVFFADEGYPASKTPVMKPGDTITRYVPNEFENPGTLGLYVRIGADHFILTNHHVLTDDYNSDDTHTHDIYDPRLRKCAEIKCNNPVARIIPKKGFRDKHSWDGKTYFVDATLAAVNANVQGINKVPSIGLLDQGLRDLSTVDLNPDSTPADNIVVRKCGGATGVTRGQVVELIKGTYSGAVTTEQIWQMRIVPSPGFHYKEDFVLAKGQDVDTLIGGFKRSVRATRIHDKWGLPQIRLEGDVFVLPGDSGSVVVDDQRKIVGMVSDVLGAYARVMIDKDREVTVVLPYGDGYACFIYPVFNVLGLDPATAVIAGGVPSSGVALPEPETEVEDNVLWADKELAMREVQAAIEREPLGALLNGLISEHYPQISHLVHRRRRVTVVWHRNGGPAFAAAFMKALAEPSGQLPTEVGGVRLVEALARFRDVLIREGDESLRHDLSLHGDWLLQLAERASSIPELVRALSEVSRT